MKRMDLLRKCPVFAGCSDSELFLFDSIAAETCFDEGEVVFSRGEEAGHLMIVASGVVRLQMPLAVLGGSGFVPLESEGRGGVLGWSSLVSPYRLTLSAQACSASTIVSMSRTEALDLMESDTALGFRIMRNIATIASERLQRTQERWSEEVQRSIDDRYR